MQKSYEWVKVTPDSSRYDPRLTLPTNAYKYKPNNTNLTMMNGGFPINKTKHTSSSSSSRSSSSSSSSSYYGRMLSHDP